MTDFENCARIRRRLVQRRSPPEKGETKETGGERMGKAKLVALMAGVFFLAAGLGSAAEKEENAGKTLFEKSCGKCHGLERPKTKKKTRAEWETTVLRMKKIGATVTEEEAKLIIDHLSEAYKK